MRRYPRIGPASTDPTRPPLRDQRVDGIDAPGFAPALVRLCGDFVVRARASAAGASVRSAPAAFPEGVALPRAGAEVPLAPVALAGARIDFAPVVAAERE